MFVYNNNTSTIVVYMHQKTNSPPLSDQYIFPYAPLLSDV